MAFVGLLDASVLVPASLRDTLLRAGEADLYLPIWSGRILEEVEGALVHRLGIPPEASRHLIGEIRAAFPDAEVTGYEALIRVMPVQRGDRHVAAAGVTGRAQVIVTENLFHFPKAPLAAFNIDVQSADEFLEHLFTLYPITMAQIIVEQAAALNRPPKSVHQVCDALELHAPRFTGLIRHAIPEAR